MHLLEKYVQGINSGKAATLAAVFAPDAIFDDEGTKKLFGKAVYLTSRKAIRRGFTFMMLFKPKASILSLKGDVMEYDMAVMGKKLQLKSTLVKEENGLIKEFCCRLRA